MAIQFHVISHNFTRERNESLRPPTRMISLGVSGMNCAIMSSHSVMLNMPNDWMCTATPFCQQREHGTGG